MQVGLHCRKVWHLPFVESQKQEKITKEKRNTYCMLLSSHLPYCKKYKYIQSSESSLNNISYDICTKSMQHFIKKEYVRLQKKFLYSFKYIT